MSIKYIIKSSGEKERFDSKKFRRSLARAGAQEPLLDQLVREVMNNPVLDTTKKIYEFALGRLHMQARGIAARYNLKNALFELGPSGYPLEKFLASVFEAHGYQVSLNQIMQGRCISHEIDIIIHKNNVHTMVESKFHAHRGLKTAVKDPLYVKARFDDVVYQWERDPNHKNETFSALLVTNTKFTSEALKYMNCVNIQALDWSYPVQANLAQLIDESGLHPVTALTTLTKSQKRKLIESNVVLCRDLDTYESALKKLGLNEQKRKKVLEQAYDVCQIQ